jgi:uncharacterized NAD-dependent epimerase/dehydratase family protein
VLDAIALGMNIVSGLHEYLGDDPEISNAAEAANVTIRDIRKPRPSKDMRLFDGSVSEVKAIRIAVLGTDCAIGKRTTATILAKVLNARGINTVLVGTGQTGLMQGAKYGIAMDAVPPQFCCGELERVIVAASHGEDPEVILIEGQGALSHPAFCTSAFILRGSQPHAVVLQHAPKRAHRCDFPTMPMPEPKSEIALIEAFAEHTGDWYHAQSRGDDGRRGRSCNRQSFTRSRHSGDGRADPAGGAPEPTWSWPPFRSCGPCLSRPRNDLAASGN